MILAEKPCFHKGGGIENLFQAKQINYVRVFNTLAQNLFQNIVATPREFYNDKIENFLTCLYLSSWLKGNFIDEDGAKIFEELSLKAIHRSLYARFQLPDVLLLLDEMPNILVMQYPIVEKIYQRFLEIFKQFLDTVDKHNNRQEFWQKFTDWEYNLKILKKFNGVNKKI